MESVHSPAPQQVPLVPTAKIPSIGVEVKNTTDGLKAAITTEQPAAMTDTQQQIMQIAGYLSAVRDIRGNPLFL
jgi:hypothetical protein